MPTITHKRRKRQGARVITRSIDNSHIYNRKAWRKQSKAFLSEPDNSLCAICLEQGRYTIATETDHVKPITQGGAIWDRSNWQPICKTHHAQKSGREGSARFNKE